MIIDFHAHIYPAKIAEKATHAIGAFYGSSMAWNGLQEELLQSGSMIGVTRYIVHSTATNQAQVESINTFIIEAIRKESRFIGFGTIHPDYTNAEAEIKRIQENGLRGIKLHPDFQHFAVDSPSMDNIYEQLAAVNIPVLVHAGDCRYDFSGPQRIRHVLEKHPNLTVIAAHFGGYTEWEASFEYLAGRTVLFDTSSTLWKLPVQRAQEIIAKHGIDRFLFGSDFPMWNHTDELARFNMLTLSETDREKVLWKNAARLLELSEADLLNE